MNSENLDQSDSISDPKQELRNQINQRDQSVAHAFPVQENYQGNQERTSNVQMLEQEQIQHGKPVEVSEAKPIYQRKVYIIGCILVSIIIFLLVMLVFVAGRGNRKSKEYNFTIEAVDQEYTCTGEIQNGWCKYTDRECSTNEGLALVERKMDTFTVENCQDFCSATSDCMSFESKLQENCKIAFKSLNTERAGHALEADKIYERSTDCYVKIPDDPSHKLAIEYFDYFETSCAQINSTTGEQEALVGYRMTDFFDDINNNENCMAGCTVQYQCIAAEWYPYYNECFYYVGGPEIKVVGATEQYLDGVCYATKQ